MIIEKELQYLVNALANYSPEIPFKCDFCGKLMDNDKLNDPNISVHDKNCPVIKARILRMHGFNTVYK